MKTCRNCIHYPVCSYSTVRDIETDCKDYISIDKPLDLLKDFIMRIKYLKRPAEISTLSGYSTFYEAVTIKDISAVLTEMGLYTSLRRFYE